MMQLAAISFIQSISHIEYCMSSVDFLIILVLLYTLIVVRNNNILNVACFCNTFVSTFKSTFNLTSIH